MRKVIKPLPDKKGLVINKEAIQMANKTPVRDFNYLIDLIRKETPRHEICGY